MDLSNIENTERTIHLLKEAVVKSKLKEIEVWEHLFCDNSNRKAIVTESNKFKVEIQELKASIVENRKLLLSQLLSDCSKQNCPYYHNQQPETCNL